MSTWTSRGPAAQGAARKGAALLLTLALSGCVVAGTSGPAPRAVAVAGGAVTVAGPAGYCIDGSASRDAAAGAFVLLGTCAALSGSAAAGQPAKPAVLTASVVPGAGDEAGFVAAFPAMARFFGSATGRAALSRAGRAETVQVAGVTSRGDVMFLNLTDTAALSGQRVEPGYWRAILTLRGHLVTLSVMSLADRPLGAAEKRQVLDAFVARMRAANGGAAAAG